MKIVRRGYLGHPSLTPIQHTYTSYICIRMQWKLSYISLTSKDAKLLRGVTLIDRRRRRRQLQLQLAIAG